MHLNDPSSIALHLKTHSIPKSKIRKILIENTTIILLEINKLRLQILEALHIKTTSQPLKSTEIILKNQKTFNTHLKNYTSYTCKQPLLMANEGSESAQDNFGKFIHQFQPETKTLIRKLERILIKLYRQNGSLLFNETCLNERLLPNHTHTHTHTHIYIYIYMFNQRYLN